MTLVYYHFVCFFFLSSQQQQHNSTLFENVIYRHVLDYDCEFEVGDLLLLLNYLNISHNYF